MRPVLFTVFGLPINSYGVSKALAVLVGRHDSRQVLPASWLATRYRVRRRFSDRSEGMTFDDASQPTAVQRRVVSSYPTYPRAARAVDFLSDHDVPEQRTPMIGSLPAHRRPGLQPAPALLVIK